MRARLLIKVFVASEAIFFLVLLLSYIYYGNELTSGPQSVQALDIKTTAIFTFFLFASSWTMHRARKGLNERRHRALKGWLIVTIIFGAIFLYGEVSEYIHFYGENLTLASNTFGSSYYTITGFHALHVFVGLLFLTIVLVLSLLGDFDEVNDATPISTAEVYWHFVDAVWVFVFGIIYVLPHLIT